MNKKEEKLKLGQRVKEIRESKGLSQTQLANKIGKDHPAINKLENGKVSAGYIFLLEVAAGLEVHIKDMIPDSAGSTK